MMRDIAVCTLTLVAASLVGCAVGTSSPARSGRMESASGPATPQQSTQSHVAGWYRGGRLQPCGREEWLQLSSRTDIEAQARAQGITTSSPVYARLEGHAQGSTFHVTRVGQVGSATPVRDCAMTGTTIQSH